MKWVKDKGYDLRDGKIKPSTAFHLYEYAPSEDEDDEQPKRFATVWKGDDQIGWRCYLEEDDEMICDSFFYANTPKEGKQRIMLMLEPKILKAAAPTLPAMNHRRI